MARTLIHQGLFEVSNEEFSTGDRVQLGDGSSGVIQSKEEREGFTGYKVRITESTDKSQVGSVVAASPAGMKKMSMDAQFFIETLRDKRIKISDTVSIPGGMQGKVMGIVADLEGNKGFDILPLGGGMLLRRSARSIRRMSQRVGEDLTLLNNASGVIVEDLGKGALVVRLSSGVEVLVNETTIKAASKNIGMLHGTFARRPGTAPSQMNDPHKQFPQPLSGANGSFCQPSHGFAPLSHSHRNILAGFVGNTVLPIIEDTVEAARADNTPVETKEQLLAAINKYYPEEVQVGEYLKEQHPEEFSFLMNTFIRSAGKIASRKQALFMKLQDVLNNTSAEFKDRELARLGMIAELDAVSLYEKMSEAASDDQLKRVALDIAKEEKAHIGEFQTILSRLDTQQVEENFMGEEEVTKMGRTREWGEQVEVEGKNAQSDSLQVGDEVVTTDPEFLGAPHRGRVTKSLPDDQYEVEWEDGDTTVEGAWAIKKHAQLESSDKMSLNQIQTELFGIDSTLMRIADRLSTEEHEALRAVAKHTLEAQEGLKSFISRFVQKAQTDLQVGDAWEGWDELDGVNAKVRITKVEPWLEGDTIIHFKYEYLDQGYSYDEKHQLEDFNKMIAPMTKKAQLMTNIGKVWTYDPAKHTVDDIVSIAITTWHGVAPDLGSESPSDASFLDYIGDQLYDSRVPHDLIDQAKEKLSKIASKVEENFMGEEEVTKLGIINEDDWVREWKAGDLVRLANVPYGKPILRGTIIGFKGGGAYERDRHIVRFNDGTEGSYTADDLRWEGRIGIKKAQIDNSLIDQALDMMGTQDIDEIELKVSDAAAALGVNDEDLFTAIQDYLSVGHWTSDPGVVLPVMPGIEFTHEDVFPTEYSQEFIGDWKQRFSRTALDRTAKGGPATAPIPDFSTPISPETGLIEKSEINTFFDRPQDPGIDPEQYMEKSVEQDLGVYEDPGFKGSRQAKEVSSVTETAGATETGVLPENSLMSTSEVMSVEAVLGDEPVTHLREAQKELQVGDEVEYRTPFDKEDYTQGTIVQLVHTDPHILVYEVESNGEKRRIFEGDIIRKIAKEVSGVTESSGATETGVLPDNPLMSTSEVMPVEGKRVAQLFQGDQIDTGLEYGILSVWEVEPDFVTAYTEDMNLVNLGEPKDVEMKIENGIWEIR